MTAQARVDLQAMNTLATPASAEHFAELADPGQLDDLLAEARTQSWPVTVLGEGSNVVLGESVPGLVLRQCSRGIEILEQGSDWVRLRVRAGENWHQFVQWCQGRGFFGLENLALIPGTVGAAPIQNIGAYGVEVAPFIECVESRVLPTGATLILDREACDFDYRDSVFKRAWRDRLLVEAVVFRLPVVPAPVTHYPSLARKLEEQGINEPTPRQVFEAVVAIRSSRLPDPAQVPNAGSFFKNPRVNEDELQRLLAEHPEMPHFSDPVGYKLAAAWLIQACGFKQRGGDVRVHEDHALVIVNPDHRPGSEIISLAEDIAAAVRQRFGIALEQEPRSYGVAAVGVHA